MAQESSRGARGNGGRRASRARTDTPRSRTSSRPGQRTQNRTRAEIGGDATDAAKNPDGTSAGPRRRPMLRVTQRALVLAVVLMLLVVSYATTLRVYFNQQYQIAVTKAAIAAHEEAISTLSDEIERWQDPAYVEIQARERLGWVIPGETGFRVIGPDGEPYGGGQQIGVGRLPDGEYSKAWWDRMWGSVQTADDPTAGEPTNTEPIRETPTASPTP